VPNFQFQYKLFLLLLAAVILFILLFVFLLRWKKSTKKKIGDPGLVNLLIRGYSSSLFTTKFILFSFAYVLGVIAVANLRVPGAGQNTTRKGIDVVFALDVSKSMWANDLQPTRLEKAKELLLQLMSKMPQDRIGLTLVAGQSYKQMPLTTDHNAAAIFISTASPDAVPSQGTDFSEAMKQSATSFNKLERRFKTIILVSDGEDHNEKTMETTDEMAEQGIMICTVGVGTEGGSSIPDPVTGEDKKDASGNVVVTKLNEEGLKTIAEKTNGIYIRLQNINDAVNQLMQQLGQVEKKSFTDVSLLDYKSYYLWFAAPMFLFLVAECLLPERKRKIA
jgi:Ca-activated chloride channel homolog